MTWFFAGLTLALLAFALRDEFRPGGSLFPAFDDVEMGPVGPEEIGPGWTIVSPHGVEIPVGTLSAAEIVEVLQEIDSYGAVA